MFIYSLLWMWICFQYIYQCLIKSWTVYFSHLDYLYVSDTRTRGIFEMRKRDGGGNIMIRQGVTGIMNVKAYTSDLHTSKSTHSLWDLVQQYLMQSASSSSWKRMKSIFYPPTKTNTVCSDRAIVEQWLSPMWPSVNPLTAPSSSSAAFTSRCNMLPNGHCSHFCFPTPSFSRVCGCPYGMKLQANQRDCIKDDSIIPPDNICGDNAFECDEGRCRPNSFRCDGIIDCVDQTDEANCTDTGDILDMCLHIYINVSISEVVEGNCLIVLIQVSTLHQEQPVLHMRSPATTSTASCPAGAVMAWMTVATVQTKSTVPLVSPPPVQPAPSPAITTGVSLQRGCVTVTTTAAMARMNTTAVSAGQSTRYQITLRVMVHILRNYPVYDWQIRPSPRVPRTTSCVPTTAASTTPTFVMETRTVWMDLMRRTVVGITVA